MQDLTRTEEPAAGEATTARRRKGHLHLDAARRLRSMIQLGELAPGERLREVQLCRQLGVSRTPLREALRTLAAEGLVTQLPNRSMVVAALNPTDIEHLYRVFGVLEGLAAELATVNITDAQIAEMGRLLTRMIELHERAERAEYMQVNGQIHRMVMDIAANPVLLSAWLSLLPRVERVRSVSNLDRDRWTGALFEHSKMFAALVARDGPLLRRLAMEHFLNGLPTIRRLYAEPKPAGVSGPDSGTPPPRARRAGKARV